MKYFSFQWHITDECDQRCRHCYIFSKDPGRALDSMTWRQLNDTFYNCLDFCEVYGRQPYFYITGGDPILHPRFWDLLALLSRRHIGFTIMGNPFHLTDEVCARLKDAGCLRYQMSLDGLRETHDWFRRPGSYDCTLQKIPMIRRAGIRCIIMTTVSGTNIREIPQLVDVCVGAGVDVFAFARYCPEFCGGAGSSADVRTDGTTDAGAGCGPNVNTRTSADGEKGPTSTGRGTSAASGAGSGNGIAPAEYRELLDICAKKFREYEESGCETYFNKKDHLWTLYDFENGDFRIPEDAQAGMIYGGCGCGSSHITILPTGDIYACRRVAGSRVGNVFEDRLADVWVTSMEAYRNFERFEKCSGCELMPWCRGCPAVARGTSGSFYSPDPQCWKVTESLALGQVVSK